jgi:hypothetical protein
MVDPIFQRVPAIVVKMRRDRAKARAEEAKELLIHGYKFNGYANRASRRASAKSAGYLPHGWSMYKATLNVQTFVKPKSNTTLPLEFVK